MLAGSLVALDQAQHSRHVGLEGRVTYPCITCFDEADTYNQPLMYTGMCTLDIEGD